MLTIWHKGIGFVIVVALAFVSTQIAHAQDEAMMELGKKVFTELAEPQCAICHTLKDAGATGEVGPILDDLKPTAERVEIAVRDGVDNMPPNENLTDEQIKAVAEYVAHVAGKSD